MIIYSDLKNNFVKSVESNMIVDLIEEKMIEKGFKIGNDSEKKSWNNSLQFVANILRNKDIKNSTYIALEYKITNSLKRIDVLLTGEEESGIKNAYIIELKQWESSENSEKHDYVYTWVGKNIREVLHPSYQASQYRYLLETFNSSVESGNIKCHSCAYLHNAKKSDNDNLLDENHCSFINETPIYFKNDYEKLTQDIISKIGWGNGFSILNELDNAPPVVSKSLNNELLNIVKNEQSFMLIDSQKEIFEKIINVKSNKSSFIINGEPGTGKSVLAINLLVKLLSLGKKVAFVTPNMSFRNILKESLKRLMKQNKNKLSISGCFYGAGSFWNSNYEEFDWIIVDESHRLSKGPTLFYKGKNQIEDLLKASKNCVFFVDDEQTIRGDNIGTSHNILNISKQYRKNNEIYFGDEYKLETQFRCSGQAGYINAIKNVLQLEETADFYLNDYKYDFRICDTPQEMVDLIRNKNKYGNKNSRIVAGYAWKWISKEKSIDELKLSINHDIVIPEHNFSMSWNENDKDMLWALNDVNVERVGCIHTCHGSEFDYCGVIIGNDLKIDNNNIIYGDKDNYFDVKGKSNLINKFEIDKKKAKIDANSKLTYFIKKIYKILLTRGQLGTYVYICDPLLREYFKKHLKNKNS